MKYEVIPVCIMYAKKFNTFEEIVHAYWYEFLHGNFRAFRVLDTYDRQHVDIEVLYNVYYRMRAEHWKRAAERRGRYEFRNGPVPNIRSHHSHRGCWDRRPKTLQENRETRFTDYDEDIKEYKVKIRKKRGQLPTYWDDLMRSDVRNDNWKRYRRTQWKG